MMNNRVKVKFFTDSYAPCAIQARILNSRLLAKVRKHLAAQPGAPEEDTALFQNTDGEQMENGEWLLNSKQAKELREWGCVTVLMDPFDILTCYGYDCNTIKA